jgi:hypothetical protein
MSTYSPQEYHQQKRDAGIARAHSLFRRCGIPVKFNGAVVLEARCDQHRISLYYNIALDEYTCGLSEDYAINCYKDPADAFREARDHLAFPPCLGDITADYAKRLSRLARIDGMVKMAEPLR